MPNWCSNRFVIYGDKGQLLKFYLDMTQGISDTPNFKPVSNSWNQMWVGNLFLAAGYSMAEIDSGNISCRGSVNEIMLEDGAVYIDDETAWGPNEESMRRMLDEKYPGLDMVFKCEEPGMGVYVNTDIEGRYLPERYLLDCYSTENSFEACDYYTTKEQLFEGIARLLGIELAVVQTFAGDQEVGALDWDAWVRAVKGLPSDMDMYFGVHEFTVED